MVSPPPLRVNVLRGSEVVVVLLALVVVEGAFVTGPVPVVAAPPFFEIVTPAGRSPVKVALYFDSRARILVGMGAMVKL